MKLRNQVYVFQLAKGKIVGKKQTNLNNKQLKKRHLDTYVSFLYSIEFEKKKDTNVSFLDYEMQRLNY